MWWRDIAVHRQADLPQHVQKIKKQYEKNKVTILPLYTFFKYFNNERVFNIISPGHCLVCKAVVPILKTCLHFSLMFKGNCSVIVACL